MAKVKNLQVTVSYKVGIGQFDMPKKVLTQIETAFRRGHKVALNEHLYQEAAEWLSDNIKERHCYEWKVEIDDVDLTPTIK